MSDAPVQPKGVAFSAPPPHLMADAARALEAVTQQLPSHASGAVVGLATDRGMNAAVVHRIGSRFAVASWVGKSWGSRITAGGAVQATW